MENTFNACAELLERCLTGTNWSEPLLRRALSEDDGRAFLNLVVERLSDAFDPALCEVYERLFAQVIEQTAPDLAPRIRATALFPTAPADTDKIYVLSRVTLGADVAVTSPLIDAVKRRYPHAGIRFVGPRKCYEMFETDSRIVHFPAPYSRGGSLAERLRSSANLWLTDGLVLDPDSRFTQLGMIAVCPPANFLHFPSRAYGADSTHRLPDLAAQWAQEMFKTENARPFVAPRPSPCATADITVSLGIGGNPAKGLEANFETELLKLLANTGHSVIVDEGGDEPERQRVQLALPKSMRTHQGSFASFASLIQQSKLYVGYDSAGGHVASACGVPVISIACGFVNPRMAARWRPLGNVLNGNAPDLLDQIGAALRVLS